MNNLIVQPKVAAIILAAAAGVLILGYFGLSYLKSSDAFHEAKQMEIAKNSKAVPIAPKVVPAPPPPIALDVQTTKPGTSEVNAIPNGSNLTPKPPAPVSAPIQIEPLPAQPAITPTPSSLASTILPAVPNDILNPTAPSLNTQNNGTRFTTVTTYSKGRFLFRNLSSGLGSDVFLSGDKTANDIDLNTFAPEGEPIDLALLNNVASNQLEVEVIAAVWTPFYWNGRQILEVGDHLLGTASSGHNRDRIIVKWNKVVFKDGKTLPINAMALHTDGTLGIKGYKVGNLFLQAIGPLLSDLVSGAASALSNQVTTTTQGINGVSTTTSNGGGNILVEAGGSAAQKAANRLSTLLAQDAEDNAPYVFVPAGTRCQAYLKSFIDTSVADYGK